MSLRIVCVETDSGNACNVGGPVCVTYKTFEVEAPPGMVKWLKEPTTKKWSFNDRSIVGVELLPEPTSACDHFQRIAAKVVAEWDGQSTAELFDEILKATGETIQAKAESTK